MNYEYVLYDLIKCKFETHGIIKAVQRSEGKYKDLMEHNESEINLMGRHLLTLFFQASVVLQDFNSTATVYCPSDSSTATEMLLW